VVADYRPWACLGPMVVANSKYRVPASPGQEYPSTNPRFFIAFRHPVRNGLVAGAFSC